MAFIYGEKSNFKPLEPDTIMSYKDKIYIIGAKYYRYRDARIRSLYLILLQLAIKSHMWSM